MVFFVASCPPVTVESSKGTYVWPKAGFYSRSEQPCKSGDKAAKAFYTCNGRGKWVDLDLKACKYNMQITQLLSDLSMVSSAASAL